MARPVLAAALLAGLLVPSASRANCALADVYFLEAQGTTVEIQAYSDRGCGAGEVLLRQAVPGGETVRVAEFCGPASPDTWIGLPYLYECVPPGTYRYGFERPFDCNRGACGSFLWNEVEVVQDASGCTRSEGNAGPTPAAPVRWGEWGGGGQYMCEDEANALGCATAPAPPVRCSSSTAPPSRSAGYCCAAGAAHERPRSRTGRASRRGSSCSARLDPRSSRRGGPARGTDWPCPGTPGVKGSAHDPARPRHPRPARAPGLGLRVLSPGGRVRLHPGGDHRRGGALQLPAPRLRRRRRVAPPGRGDRRAVRLADFCKPFTDPKEPKPYLDECVPAGTYRYGFEVPYTCASSGCATERWDEHTVPAEPVGCVRTGGNPGPTPVAPVGWAEGTGHVCEAYSTPDDAPPPGCSTAAGTQTASLALAAAALLRRRRRCGSGGDPRSTRPAA